MKKKKRYIKLFLICQEQRRRRRDCLLTGPFRKIDFTILFHPLFLGGDYFLAGASSVLIDWLAGFVTRHLIRILLE